MKRQKDGKTLFGAVILLLMTVLAGTVAFAAEQDLYEKCDDMNPRAPYFPLIIEKKWADPDKPHPDHVDIVVNCYTGATHTTKGKWEKRTIRLDESNHWRWVFDPDCDVQVLQEVQPADGPKYRADITYSNWSVDAYGRYLCTVTNRQAYTLTYTYQFAGDKPDNFAMPDAKQFAPGEMVKISTPQFEDEDDYVDPDEEDDAYDLSDLFYSDGYYRFCGWEKIERTDGKPIDVSLTNGSTFSMPESDVVLTGRWEKIDQEEYNVNWEFVVQGGKPDNLTLPDLEGITRRVGERIRFRPSEDSGVETDEFGGKTVCTDGSGQDYYLQGWYTDPECTKPLTGRMPAHNIKVYGYWAKTNDAHTITYHYKNSPEEENFILEENSSKKYMPGERVRLKWHKNFSTEKDGKKYHFSGWFQEYTPSTNSYSKLLYGNLKPDYSGANDNYDWFVMPDHNLDLWGFLDSNKYTITWEVKGLPDELRDKKDNIDWPYQIEGQQFPYNVGAEIWDHPLGVLEINGDRFDDTNTTERVVYVFSGWDYSQIAEAETEIRPNLFVPGHDATITGSWGKKKVYPVIFEWKDLPKIPDELKDNFEVIPEYKPGSGDNMEITFSYSTWSDGIEIDGKTYFFAGFKANGVEIEEDRYGTYHYTPSGATTITGEWKERTYRVSYSDGCGGAVFPTKYYRGNYYDGPTPVFTGQDDDGLTADWGTWTNNGNVKQVGDSWVPVRDGYTFVKWVPTDGKYATWQNKVTDCVNYAAEWQPNNRHTLTIRYLEEGSGKVLHDPFIRAGMLAGEPYIRKSPAVAGYELVNGTQATVSGTMPDHDLQIDVTYNKIENAHTVTYKWTGLENAEPSLDPDYMEYVFPKPEPLAPSIHKAEEDISLDSRYTEGSIYQRFNGLQDGLQYAYTNYAFSGWLTITILDGDGNKTEQTVQVDETGTFVMPAANVLIEGKWEQDSNSQPYTVKYDWSSGMPIGLKATLPQEGKFAKDATVSVDRKYTNIYTEDVNGRIYRFSGWTKAEKSNDKASIEGFTEETTSFTMPADDVTIYGSWTPVVDSSKKATYTVTWYDADTGEQIPLTDKTPNPEERSGEIDQNVSVTPEDLQVSGWTYKWDDGRNLSMAVLKESGTELKLYFSKNSEAPTTHKLTVKKEVADSTDPTAFTFEVTLTGADNQPISIPDVMDENGKITFTLKRGEERLSPAFPPGRPTR